MQPHELRSTYPTHHDSTTEEFEIQPHNILSTYDTSFTDQSLGSSRIHSVTDVSGSSEAGDEEGDHDDDDGAVSKTSKAKEKLKKVGKKVKKAFQPLARLGHSHDKEVAAPK